MNDPIDIATAARRREQHRPRSGTTVLDETRERLLTHLQGAVALMFEQVDDSLFQLADQSNNNAEQNRYFDAMREIRLKRPEIERRFSDCVSDGFDTPEAAEEKSNPNGLTRLDSDSLLSLVDNDELEETLAIDNLVEKLEGDCADTLYALDQRMTKLRGTRVDESNTNPAAPRRLCEAFREASRCLDIDISVRLLFYKLFDRHVATSLGDCYENLNGYLARKGILPTVATRAPGVTPTIRRAAKRQPREEPPEYLDEDLAPPPPGGGGTGGGHPDVVAHGAASGGAYSGHIHPTGSGPGGGLTNGSASGGVRRESSDALSTGAGNPAGATGVPGGPIAGIGGPGSPVSAADLLSTLHQVMTAQGAKALAGEATATGAATIDMLTGLQQGVSTGAVTSEAGLAAAIDPALLANGTTNVIRVLRESTLSNEASRVDGMMIDIVALLFDSILDDPGIAGPFKALIGRLQIPVLKVAILDKTFFSRKFHPARALLNKLADAAVGAPGDADENDPLHVAMDDIVHRVLDDFEDDVRVFKRAVQELDTYLANEEREARSRMEQALQEIQAEERLRFARKLAAEEINHHLEDATLPAVVREFLDVYWKSYLQLAYIDGGEDGEAWQKGLETMDDLVWSLTPKSDEEERQRLKVMLPTLPVRLKEGLARVPMGEEFRKRFLATLVRLHLAALRPTETPPTDEHECADPAGEDSPGDEAHEDLVSAAEAEFFDLTGGDDAESETGEVASEAAPDEVASSLRVAIEDANRRIFETATARPECEGMGTTVVAARIADGEVTMAHVGDSRLYRLRDGAFEQLTSDHSLRQQLVDQGFLTPEEAKTSTRKNYITRAVGIDNDVVVDTRSEPCAPGDTFLLCSDGLCDMVEDEDMAALLLDDGLTLQETTQMLIDRANENGGKDNISVILVAVDDTDVSSWDMCALTDVGCNRSHNEDYVGCESGIGLAVLADGMGGYNAGEVASELAVSTILAHFDAATAAGDAEPTDITSADDASETDINEMLFGTSDVDIEEIDIAAVPDDADVEHADAVLDGGARPSEAVDANIEADDFPALDDIAEDVDEDDDGIEEIVIHDVGSSSVAEDEHTETADTMAVGDWVEFERESTGRMRARLTWVSSATGNYLFTNRQGHKVADTTPQGLAVEFRRGTARKLAAAPLFDRAVSSLMDRLRGDNADPLASGIAD